MNCSYTFQCPMSYCKVYWQRSFLWTVRTRSMQWLNSYCKAYWPRSFLWTVRTRSMQWLNSYCKAYWQRSFQWTVRTPPCSDLTPTAKSTERWFLWTLRNHSSDLTPIVVQSLPAKELWNELFVHTPRPVHKQPHEFHYGACVEWAFKNSWARFWS